MLADARPALLPLKAYAIALGILGLGGFIAGGAANFVYATRHPGADPYAPKPTPVQPAQLLAPAPMEKVKAPALDAPKPADAEAYVAKYGAPDTTGVVMENRPIPGVMTGSTAQPTPAYMAPSPLIGPATGTFTEPRR